MSSKPLYSIKPVLRVLWQHTKPYRGLVWFIALAAVVSESLQSLALPYIGKLLFDGLGMSIRDASGLPQVMQTIYLLAGVSVVSLIVSRCLGYTTIYFQSRMMAELEQTSFSYMLGHAYQFFQDNFSGSLVRRISRISRAFEDIADNVQQKLIPILVSSIGILYILFHRNVLIGALVFVWLVVMFVYNYFYTNWKVGQDVERAAQDSVCTGFLSDAISNILTIKVFTGGKRETNTFREESNKLQALRFRAWKTHEFNYGFQAFVLLGLQIGVLTIAVRYWSLGALSIGDVVLFQSYFTILNSRVLDFSRMIRSLYAAFTDASEMVEILDKPQAIKDRRGAKILSVPSGEVGFENVDFSYGSEGVLRGFDLRIKPGEKIALVGSSGAGKSTVIKLLFRFYDVTAGTISIDGQAIDKVTQDSLRAAIGLVPQETVLFHRSLLDNIRYGRPGATEAEVVEAAKLANCDDFIQRLPLKYDTFVGERGVKLSGGERQRVAIARAILKNAPILVLDEATSSLDSESEGLIQDALRTLMQGKTTIVIAHRLSTIMSMDRIVIMDGGRIVDRGTHTELLAREGIYQKLWNIQVGGFFQDLEMKDGI